MASLNRIDLIWVTLQLNRRKHLSGYIIKYNLIRSLQPKEFLNYINSTGTTSKILQDFWWNLAINFLFSALFLHLITTTANVNYNYFNMITVTGKRKSHLITSYLSAEHEVLLSFFLYLTIGGLYKKIFHNAVRQRLFLNFDCLRYEKSWVIQRERKWVELFRSMIVL